MYSRLCKAAEVWKVDNQRVARLAWDCCPWSCVAVAGDWDFAKQVVQAWGNVQLPPTLTWVKQCESLLQIAYSVCQHTWQ